MRIRLAALTTFLAAGIIWFGGNPKPDDLAAACINFKGTRSEVIAACTTLIDQDGTAEEHRHLLLTKRAWVYRCNGQYDLALADVNQALELQPENSQTWILRARINRASGNYDAARDDFSQVSEAFPDDAYVTWEKAKFLEDIGEREAALAIYQRLQADYPNTSEVAESIVSYHFDSGNHEFALDLASNAAVRWPEEDWVYLTQLLYALNYTGDHESALDAATELARLKSKLEYELLMPALIHLKIGDEKAGVGYVSKYADAAVERALADMDFFSRWYRRIPNWVVLGQDEEWLYRYMMFAALGRTDLAKAEIEVFLRDTGRNGRKILLKVVAATGVTVSPEAQAGSEEHLNEVIATYLEHIQATSGFNEYGPKAKQSRN